ncbi:HNH endonuclease family protein [Microcystis sp. M049S2]|uniref:HNH endonuclease family protein n=1 Tax=Microcystis sp. M049S2 TaxID=2771169 RepID=UPI00258E4BFD|nr:HNH endonuclease family protein [Microcystis sp. M049S2]
MPWKVSNDRVKLILETIERRMTKEMVDTDNLTIEHIMPQKLTPNWQDMLGDNHEQIHKTWLHTLGNLTLTAYNSDLSNKQFLDKVSLFNKKTNVSLNKYFYDKNVWNKEEIEKRANYLADLAIEIWSR